jgi:cytochrome P450
MPNDSSLLLDQLLSSPEIMQDPYPIYARLREEAPVFWSDLWQSWVVSRYDDVNASLREKENLSNENRQGLLFHHLTDEERQTLSPLRHYFAQKDVIGSDGADHTRMRALVQKAFTPKTVASLEPRVRHLAAELLTEAKKSACFDFIDAVAHPLPIVLIAELLGAPVKDRPLFKRWSSDILAFQGTGKTTFAAAMISQTALLELFDYILRLIEERRAQPQDDLMTTLAFAEEAGQGFSRDELLATCNTLLTAGHETTTNLMGNLVHLLHAHPEQWLLVKADPALLGSAIEEALRFDAPKQRNFRRVKKAHVFNGVAFEENQMVFQLIGSANHDPRKFENPDVFDIRRMKIDHLSFGSGSHFCLGAPLARMEARVVLELLLKEMPECRLARPVTRWQPRVQMRGPQELWLETESG